MSTSPSILNDVSNAFTNFNPVSSAILSTIGSTAVSVAQTVNSARQTTTSITTYSFAENPKYYLYITAEDYTRQDAMTLAKANITQQISMPVPMQMVDSHKVEYSTQELGVMGGAMLNGAGALMNTARQGGSNISNIFQSATSLYGASTSLIGSVAGAGTALAFEQGNQTVSRVAQAAAGVAPNQFMVVLLKGPTYKKFTFEWHLSPKTQQQSAQLRDMIKFFNNAMAPTLTGGGFFFGFPKIFRIQFRPTDEYMYKFKPAVLENFTANYTGAGVPAFYKSGAPESYKISMSFMEMEFWLNGQF